MPVEYEPPRRGGGSPPPESLAYTHDQQVASDTWVIPHGLGFKPGGILVLDTTGAECEGEITHDSDDQLTIHFSAAFSGQAFLS